MRQVFTNGKFVQVLRNSSGRFQRETEHEMLLCLPGQGENVLGRLVPHKTALSKIDEYHILFGSGLAIP